MNEPVQLTLDIFPETSKGKGNGTGNIAPFSVVKSSPFDFKGLFNDDCRFEEKHSENSMAILGDCLEILKGMKSKSVKYPPNNPAPCRIEETMVK